MQKAAAAMVLRWGIIGCGDVTEVKSGPAFRSAENSKLVAVMRRDAEKAKDYAERHEVPKWYNTLEGILTDPEVDAIYVATPPGSHLEVALEVAKHGKPCYLEKPMARNLTESMEIAKAFELLSIPLFVAYYRRSYKRFLRLKALLDSGRYGPVSSVQYRLERPAPPGATPQGWRQDASVSGGGLFVDLGSHALDLLDFLFGPLQLRGVAARRPGAAASEPEDSVAVAFACGEQMQTTGTGVWNFQSTETLDVLEITTSNAKILLPDFMNGQRVSVKSPDGTVLEEWEEAPPSTVQLPMIQSVTTAILHRDPSLCASDARSALRTAGYMDEALESFYGGRADTFWKRVESWGVNSKS